MLKFSPIGVRDQIRSSRAMAVSICVQSALTMDAFCPLYAFYAVVSRFYCTKSIRTIT